MSDVEMTWLPVRAEVRVEDGLRTATTAPDRLSAIVVMVENAIAAAAPGPPAPMAFDGECDMDGA
jgi:hypothetical protein